MTIQLLVEVRMPQPEEFARELVCKIIQERQDRMTLLDAVTILNVGGDQMNVLELTVTHPGVIEF